MVWLIPFLFPLGGLVWLNWQGLVNMGERWFYSRKGQLLLHQLVKARAMMKQGQLVQQTSFTGYKNYEDLAALLIRLRLDYGGVILSSWGTFLNALREDLRLQKKMEKWRNEGLGQMLLMNLFIWMFIILFLYQLEISPGRIFLWLLGIGIWQILGILVFSFLFFRQLERLRKFSARALKFLVHLESLQQCALSIQEVLDLSGWHKLGANSQKNWTDWLDQAALIIDSWQKSGQGIQEGVVELKSEFWFIFQGQSQDFEKRLKIMQVGIAAVFVIPSFFAFTLGALSSFLGA